MLLFFIGKSEDIVGVMLTCLCFLFDHHVFKFRIGVAGDQTQLNVRAVVGHFVGLGSVVKFCAVIGDLHIKLTVGIQGHGVGGDLQP